MGWETNSSCGFMSLARLLFTVVLLSGGHAGRAVHASGKALHESTRLLVFGDSYVDTGNHNSSDTPWRYPYGMTWPHHPSGRYSDGGVLTDFVAKEMNGTSPVPYRLYQKLVPQLLHRRHSLLHKILQNGINFAVGGSGVFEAFNPNNLSVQVDSLQTMLTLQPFPLKSMPLQQTLVLVSVNGNDYSLFLQNNNGTTKGLADYIPRVVAEIIRNIERLYGMGLRRFIVGNELPQGCLPTLTFPVFYKHCSPVYDPLVQYHNKLLTQGLNASFTAFKDADLFLLDQYKAFSSLIAHPSSFGIKHKLQPCCVPKAGKNCGDVDANGVAEFKVCSNPNTHLFWDAFHPTQHGWNVITSLAFGSSSRASGHWTPS